MGIFSLFKPSERAAARGRPRSAPPPAREAREAVPEEEVLATESAADAAIDTGQGHSILDAIGLVGEKVDTSSTRIQTTVLHASSEQNSVIQGIYRLIDQRTMDRADLNKRRREAWKVISESLSDVRLELSELAEIIRSAGLGPDVLDKLERAIESTREETQTSRERLEQALAELREAQWARLEGMLAELRDAERERVDTIVGALREEAEKRVEGLRGEAEKRVEDVRGQAERRLEEARQAGELRVFDAMRTGDERVVAQREVHQTRVGELEELYKGEIARLEASYLEITREKERLRRETILGMIASLDALEARLQSAEDAIAAREREHAAEGEEGEEGAEKKRSFFGKLFGQRRRDEKEDPIVSRLAALELGVLEAQRESRSVLEELRRVMLDSLEREGVRPIYSVGETFDPELHVRIDEVEGGPAGSILRERRRGYLLGGEVLRRAEVIVLRG